MTTELPPEDQPAYDALVDPDDHSTSSAPTPTFEWEEDFQRMVLGSLCKDRQLLAQTIDLVKPDYFTTKYNRKIASVLFEYFKEYKGLPSRTTLLTEVAQGAGDDVLAYKAAVDVALAKADLEISGREYIRAKLVTFAKRQALIAAINQALPKIKQPRSDSDIEEALAIIARSVTATNNFDIGTDYFATIAERLSREDIKPEVFTTGIPVLDDQFTDGGLRRGGAYAVGAPSGVGKSIFLTTTSVANIKVGKRVLYVSLEMAEDEIAQRFDSMLSGTPIKAIYDHATEVIAKVTALADVHDDKQLLVVKQFPPRSATAATIQAYLDQLALVGFRPDLVMVDYLGEMKVPPKQAKHEALEDLSSALKGLAVENNLCLVTAIQINRDGAKTVKEGGTIDDSNLADSYGQVRPLDAFWTINRDGPETTAGVGRLHVAKNRNGRCRETIRVQFDPLTLAIGGISENGYRARIQGYTGEKNRSDESRITDFFARKNGQS